MSAFPTTALLGLGEVGQILAQDLRALGVHELRAWDILFPQAGSSPARAAARLEVKIASHAREAVGGAQLVISAVTADQDLEAARAASAALTGGAFFLDLNSVSPDARREVAQLVASHGARYVEAAVMAPVPPKRLATPMLLGGPHAAEFLPLAQRLGFKAARMFSPEVGPASAAKMCRSVVVKGLEALMAESMLAARHYGVESAVLESLRELFPVADWEARARYMISRSLLHGQRRAEEMHEVAKTVTSAGVEPSMSEACAKRQAWAARHRGAAEAGTLGEMLDVMLGNDNPRRQAR